MPDAIRFAVGALIVGACTVVFAQEPPPPAAPVRKPPSPEEMQKSMDAAVGSMVPMMVKMTEAMMEAQLSAAEKPETAARIAAFKRNLYLALQKQGFKPAEALQIVLNTSPPAAAFAGK